ncbi:putative glycoside hydrolase (plasmid) [Halorussus limi]|uniref:Putative glycoside hydrolase n=1 Tax=Halorussus limi TaxID=2938695 RepID=A0A8U0I0X8_9EURY|nr:putative glycoside hydrolase [Halorussus limi]UPV76809.1 putative glycoside hydrolase [Halorussus limi]
MVAVWSYPWRLLSQDPAETRREFVEMGVTSVTVAAHYHSIRTLDPRAENGLFESYEGGCYFDPDRGAFADTSVDPPVNEVDGRADPFGDVVELLRESGIDVNAWLVCFHNSKLGAENPALRVQSAFGDDHEHAFCPSQPAVRAYFEDVARSLAEYDIEAINLESLGFPSAFHGHGATFGHAKNHVVSGAAEEMLVSQCFCSACRERAADHPVDFDRARSVVRSLVRDVVSEPTPQVSSLERLVADRPVLEDLFDFRASVIETFVEGVAAASGGIDLTYSASDGLGRDPNDGWPAGVVLDRIRPHLDRIVALCYTDDRELARRRVRRYREAVDVPVDAGVTLDPDVVGTETEWRGIVDGVSDLADEVHVYNHALMSDAHLDWFDEAAPHLGQ